MTFKPSIRKAQRYKVKASIMIEGLTGSGKTGLALCIAHALSGKEWEKVGMIDTENRSADLIVGQEAHVGEAFGEFLKVDLTDDEGYAPINYLAAAKALNENGCEAIIFDSTTHAWARTGGVLDLVTKAESQQKSSNKFIAWNTPEVVLNKNALFEMIRNQRYHIITTVRVKEKFGMELGDDGRNKVKSLGEQQIQTEGLKYEPDLVLSMVAAGTPEKAPVARVVKSRYPMLKLDEVYSFTPALIEQIRIFLEEGADPKILLEQQKEEYITAVKQYCTQRPNQKAIWDIIKKESGFENVNIKDIPLQNLKVMYVQLTAQGD